MALCVDSTCGSTGLGPGTPKAHWKKESLWGGYWATSHGAPCDLKLTALNAGLGRDVDDITAVTSEQATTWMCSWG